MIIGQDSKAMNHDYVWHAAVQADLATFELGNNLYKDILKFNVDIF